MSKQKDHRGITKSISGKFSSNQRYTNFGPIIEKIEITGFRGVRNLSIDITSPVTAFSGLNGTGKSTVAQLFSCAYKKPTTAVNSRYYIKQFFPVSPIDPEPFTQDAKVVYTYSTEKGDEASQKVTITRRSSSKWGEYKRQPERNCYYIGFTQFIPKVEKRDFSIYSAQNLRLGESRNLTDAESNSISKILSLPYENLSSIEVSSRLANGELAVARRAGKDYSENHMGFGEGRVFYIVRAMELAPLQSLFVLEEPETSLHGNAQRMLAQYFVEVCDRRGHQIIITTHSTSIIKELPRDSVVHLRREMTGDLSATTGLSTYQVDSYLEGHKPGGGVTICVEDTFAKFLIQEILRRKDRHLLSGCSFFSAGGCQQIPPAVAILEKAGLTAAGVSDGDVKFKLGSQTCEFPQGEAPEKFVFQSASVHNYFSDKYGVDVPSILSSVTDHHDYAHRIGVEVSSNKEIVEFEAIQAYVSGLSDLSEFDIVLSFLEEKLFKKG